MISLNARSVYLPLFMMFLVTTWLSTQKLFSQNIQQTHPYYFQLQLNIIKSSNPIYSMVEGKPGEYFFATDNGIVRFDGQSAHFIENTTLHTNAGASLQKDKFNNIYFENFDGYVFNLKRDSLVLINQNKAVFYLPYGIWNDQLHIIQPNGLDIYHTITRKLQRTIPFEIGNPKFSVQLKEKFYIVGDDFITAVDSIGIIKKSLSPWEKSNKTKLVYTDQELLYVCDRDNWGQTITVLDSHLNYKETIHLRDRHFIQNIKFVNNEMWILTKNGVEVYKKNNSKYSYAFSLFQGISVTDMMSDRKGVTWFTTVGNGVLIIPNLAHQYLKGIPEKINTISKSNNQYFFGTNDGKIYVAEPPFIKYKLLYQHKNSIDNILVEDSLNQLFLVDNTGFTSITKNKSEHVEFALKAIVTVDHKYLAIATSNLAGLMIKAGAENQTSEWDAIFQKLSNDGKIASILEGIRSKNVAYDPDSKTIYMSTNAGLYRFDQSEKLEEVKDQGQSIIAKNITFYQNKLYYNTYKGQLKLIVDGKVEILSFQNQWIKSFKREGANLIIMLNDHFLKYNIDQQTVQYIPIRIDNLEITDYHLEDEYIILLTNEGVIRAKVEDIQMKNLPDFFLQKLGINDSVFSDDFKLILDYDQNNITIDYYINDIGTYIPFKIYYQINQDGWKPLDVSQQHLSFLKIQPGDYSVKFKMNDQILDTSVQFTIKSPFWKTYWFYGLLFLAAIASIYLYYHWRIKVFGKQIRLLREKVELERQLGQSILTSVKAQMNPHFFFNALNTIQAYIMKNDKAQAINYLSKFSLLTRRILNYSEKDAILLAEEMDSLKLYMELEQVRANNRFTFLIDAESIQEKIYSIVIPSMLIQPYVENAIKHGILPSEKQGEIHIRFAVENRKLIVTVDDNGIGRKAAANLNRRPGHDSFSMKANQKRLDVLNRVNKSEISFEIIDKEDESGNSLGTKVKIHIPLKTKDTERHV